MYFNNCKIYCEYLAGKICISPLVTLATVYVNELTVVVGSLFAVASTLCCSFEFGPCFVM